MRAILWAGVLLAAPFAGLVGAASAATFCAVGTNGCACYSQGATFCRDTASGEDRCYAAVGVQAERMVGLVCDVEE